MKKKTLKTITIETFIIKKHDSLIKQLKKIIKLVDI